MFVTLFVLGAVISNVLSQGTYCDRIVPPVPPCPNNAPRDLLFLVDGSNSMNRARFYSDMLDYTLSLYCAFDPNQPNQAGMLIFNQEIKILIQLDEYSQQEWFDKVQEVRDNPNNCCSCCTPTAEAFDLARTHFNEFGKNIFQIAFAITDGLPSNNNVGIPGINGNPDWWYVLGTGQFNPATYNLQVVPERANLLKADGVRIFLVGVPNIDGDAPDQKYFDGTYGQGRRYCVVREQRNFCGNYFAPPFPIVSLPISQNSFSTSRWNVQGLIQQTVGALCENPPTNSPSGSPTRPPTKIPTALPTASPTRFDLSQIDVTFLVDRSQSMNWRQKFCEQELEEMPDIPGWDYDKNSISACWELFMRYIYDQSLELVKIRAGTNGDRALGWADDFPFAIPARGLRVKILGFACKNKQKSPLVFQFSQENGGAITNERDLVRLLDTLRQTVLPDGGTCPGLAIEQAVRYIEDSPVARFPLQTVILITDGRFYDMPYPERATQGLAAYSALRFSIGIAVAADGSNYGLTPDEILIQKSQLLAFVGGKTQLFKDLGQEGWKLLPQVAQQIAIDLPTQYVERNPIPRYTWCGWRRQFMCASDEYRFGRCRWTKSAKQWGCKRA